VAERNGCHPKEVGSAPLACPEQSRRVRAFAGFERRARFSTRADFILKLISEQTVGNISFRRFFSFRLDIGQGGGNTSNCHPEEGGSATDVRAFASFERRSRFSTRADFILKLLLTESASTSENPESNNCHPEEEGSATLACPERSRRVRAFASLERHSRPFKPRRHHIQVSSVLPIRGRQKPSHASLLRVTVQWPHSYLPPSPPPSPPCHQALDV